LRCISRDFDFAIDYFAFFGKIVFFYIMRLFIPMSFFLSKFDFRNPLVFLVRYALTSFAIRIKGVVVWGFSTGRKGFEDLRMGRKTTSGMAF
jgi:hypothetical protein